jgi:hypothetical protein
VIQHDAGLDQKVSLFESSHVNPRSKNDKATTHVFSGTAAAAASGAVVETTGSGAPEGTDGDEINVKPVPEPSKKKGGGSRAR